jgi:two-component system heavy metal sensor histidine kinase CusS
MRRPLSLRVRIGLALAGVLALSLVTSSVVLHVAFRRALVREFDARLASDAGAVTNMVEEHSDGSLEFEARALPTSRHETGPAYFEVWTSKGAPVARSSSLGGADLPRAPQASTTQVTDVTLPDGRPGRAYQAAALAHSDGDLSGQEALESLYVVMARGTGEIEETMSTLRALLVASCVTALALALLAGGFAIQQGLAPLRALTVRLDTIDAQRLGERLPTAGLPGELQAPVVKLNLLLERLSESFSRERRFGADASHELRTPLAGLRTILEVAASRPRPVADYVHALSEALIVVRHMSGLVESLLALARLDARSEPPRQEAVSLRELVETCYAPYAARAESRGLRVENRVAPGALVMSDPERLRIAAANLIANAVEYTAPGGSVVVDSNIEAGRVLTVRDSGPPIPADALDRIFDRFFRLDEARSGQGEHWGIGLALVRSICDGIGLEASAENADDGSVAFSLTRKGARLALAGAGQAPGHRA